MRSPSYIYLYSLGWELELPDILLTVLSENVTHCAGMPQVLDDKGARPSIMILLDTPRYYSGYVPLLAKEAENIARSEIRVGVISFSSSVSIDIPL